MYLDYWGFSEFPFENVPDPDFFYMSKAHEEALTRMLYAAEMRKGGAMLSGDIGCGKTTLSKVYVQELSEDKFDIGLIINPKLEAKEFLQEVLYQFDITDVPETKVKCLQVLNEKMISNLKNNKDTLLIVDEAQLLEKPTFEEIRLLLNFQLNNRFLLTIILLGQPELREKVNSIEQLNQRIAIKYHLRPFDQEETTNYILFRQEKAGKKENAFNDEAINKIYEHSGGVPRKINNLCDLSLLIGFSSNEKIVGPDIIENIITDGALF
ncbi:MAG: AAA family ATPase [Deltaproteobacteria bacterium]|nr:AAA family ATPase [Deltaproteobacteria bacterium]